VSAGPNNATWQSISIFSIKFKFSFVKSDLMRRTDCGPTLCRLHPSDTHSAWRSRATGFGFAIYVPVPAGNGQPEKKGRFSLKAFSYDEAAGVYRCPGGELLRPMEGVRKNTSGRTEIRYASSTKACRVCPLHVV
jgi:hypothetical protein